MAHPPTDDTDRNAAGLIAKLRALGEARCPKCGASVCSHVALMGIALGAGVRPTCLSCLATALARDARELRDSLHTYLHRQECHRLAWAWASQHEGFGADPFPACLFPDGAPPHPTSRLGTILSASSEPADSGEAPTPPSPPVPEANDRTIAIRDIPPIAAEWDAGDLACGELVLELRQRLQALPPEAVLRLRACDPGVPADLPAWCRLMGHRLLHSAAPTYHLQRKP